MIEFLCGLIALTRRRDPPNTLLMFLAVSVAHLALRVRERVIDRERLLLLLAVRVEVALLVAATYDH